MISNVTAPQIMSLEIDGVPYTGFTDPISASCSVENLCGTFTFTATQPKLNDFPIKRGDSCRVLVNDTPVVNGFVEEITVQYDTGNHSITIEGRDKTCDIVDSTLDGKITFHAPLDLIAITQQVLTSLGITGMSVTSNVTLAPFSQGEIISAEVGQTAFEFIEYYAKKRQVLMTTDGDGNIVFTQSGTEEINTVIANSETILSKPIIKSASMSLSETKKFNKYIAYAHTNSAAMQIVTDFSQLPVDQEVTMISAPAYDVTVRPSRIYNFSSDTSHLNQGDLNTRAIWESNVRRANGFKYSVVVQGFVAEQDGELWRPNQLVTVVDDVCDIDSVLLISSVKYNYSLSGGSETTLELVDKDSFTVSIIDAPEQTKKAKVNKQGTIYSLEDFSENEGE
jgi:prophage tail gpP-like protein